MMLEAKERLFGRKIIRKEVVYDGFSLRENGNKGVQSALFSVNCDCTDGVLTQNVGAQEYTLNGTVLTLPKDLGEAKFFTAVEKDTDGNKKELFGYVTYYERAYIYNDETGEFENIGTLEDGGAVTSALDADGEYKTIFVCGAGIYRLNNRRLIYCTDIPCQAAACFCGGRVFTVSKDFWLVYSAPFAPADYTENVDDSGKIALRGDCGKIVGLTSLKNRLCVLYEYGISVIELAGTARSFVRKDYAYNGERILEESLCVANVGGEKAYFLALDGVYRFDGVNVEKVCKNLPVRAVAHFVCGRAVAAGKYLVTYTDENGDRKTVAVDLESGEGCETFTMKGLCPAEGKTAFAYGTKVYSVRGDGALPSGEEAKFVLPDTDFGVLGNKTLKALRFQGEGAFTLIISDGRKTKTQMVTMQDGGARVRLSMRGNTFAITFKLTRGAKIRGMTAELQTLG